MTTTLIRETEAPATIARLRSENPGAYIQCRLSALYGWINIDVFPEG